MVKIAMAVAVCVATYLVVAFAVWDLYWPEDAEVPVRFLAAAIWLWVCGVAVVSAAMDRRWL